MLKKFKLEALTWRKTKKGRAHVWATYVVMANDPFDARDKAHVKYPGRHFKTIRECTQNGDNIVGRTWTASYLAKHEAEIKIMYDLQS